VDRKHHARPKGLFDWIKDEQQTLWEPGGTETARPAGTARRYRKPLAKLCALDLRILASDTYEEWHKHKTPRLSAALAFYTVLSLAPLLVAFGSVITSLLFNAGKLLVGIYLGKTGLASAYGAAGSSLISFLGAEFTQVFANRYGSAPTLRVRRLLLGKLPHVTPPLGPNIADLSIR
jgi:hypothetical protein